MKRNKKYITSPKSKTGKDERGDLVSVVLLSENHGYRMKSYGPISLVQVGGKSLIERQIESIQAAFLNFEIILCSGFETEKIVNFVKDKYYDVNIRVVENQVHYNSNCCESARLCINNTTNNKILLCGGSVLIHPAHLEMIDLQQSSIVTQDENSNSLVRHFLGVLSDGVGSDALRDRPTRLLCDRTIREFGAVHGESDHLLYESDATRCPGQRRQLLSDDLREQVR